MRRDGTDFGVGIRRAPTRRWAMVLSMLAFAASIGAAAYTVRHGRMIGATVSFAADRAFAALGFGIDEIIITGHRYTLDADVFSALRAEGSGSLIRFDAADARRRIEALPWIDTARITRVLPNGLTIDVTERRPIAVWLSGDAHVLVDTTGRSLAQVTAAVKPELPRITGKGAPEAASVLFEALALHPGIRSRVELARRVGERRWTLDLGDGSRVHLPEHGLDAALQQLADLEASGPAVTEPRVIDLRRGNSLVAIRSTKPGSEAIVEPTGRSPRNM